MADGNGGRPTVEGARLLLELDLAESAVLGMALSVFFEGDHLTMSPRERMLAERIARVLEARITALQTAAGHPPGA